MSKITSAMVALGVVAGLGVTALPLSSYADVPTSEAITVRATINEELAISIADTNGVATDLVNFGAISKGSSADKIQTIAVTVSGNVPSKKYDLGVMDFDENTNMVNTTVSGSGVIPTITVPEGENALKVLTGGWGWRVENRHDTREQGWKAMIPYNAEGAGNNVVSNGDLDDSNVGEPVNVQFGINVTGVDTDTNKLETGVYEDKIVFTATAVTATVEP